MKTRLRRGIEMVTMAEAVIKRIHDLCEEKDMSIYKLSRLSNVSQSTLNEIMQGRSEHPRVNTLKNIAHGFGLKGVREFFDDDIFDEVINESNVEDNDQNENHLPEHKDTE